MVEEKTAIRIGKDLLKELAELKVHPREPYEDVIRKLLEKWKSTK